MRVPALLCTVLLLATAAVAVPPPPVVPPAIHSALPGPISGSADGEPATPDIPHETGAVGAGALPLEVRMEDIPVDDTPGAAGSFSHIQGQFSGGEDLGPYTPIDTPEPGNVALGPVPDAPPIMTKAVGDFVYAFPGIWDTGWFPPDPILAVGPNHVIAATNSHFTIYSKLGNVKRPLTSFASFFGGLTPAGWQGLMFDPKVIYSAATNQFVMIALGRDDTNQLSHCFIGISQTQDPMGSWWFYQLPNTWGVAGDADAWWDYASVGADSWGLYLTGNFYYWVGGFKYSVILALNPAVFSGGANNGWKFFNLTWPGGGSAFNPQVAQPQSIDPGQATFFVNSYFSVGSQVALWKMTGDRGHATIAPSLTNVAIGTSPYWSIGENVAQPGTAHLLDGGDARVLNAVYSQSRVYFTLTSDPFANLAQSGVFLGKLNAVTNTNEWDYTLQSGAGVYYFYPAIAVAGGSSTSPNLATYSSWTQPAVNQFASGNVKLYTTHPPNGLAPNYNVIAGHDWYERRDNSNRNRWGDYSGGVYDFTCGHFWGITEYAGPSGTWRTGISSQIAAGEAPCPLVDLTFPNGGQSFTAGDNVTGTWSVGSLDPGEEIRFSISAGSDFVTLATGLPTSTTFLNFQMPNVHGTNAQILVGSWNGLNYTTYDWSDQVFTVTGFPELELDTLTPPASAFPGQTVSIVNGVENTGPLPAGNFQIDLRYSSNNQCTVVDDLIASRTVSSLAAGASDSASTQATIPAGAVQGLGYICIFIDPLGSVGEFDENNNIVLASFTVTQAPQPIFTDGFESGNTSAWTSTQP